MPLGLSYHNMDVYRCTVSNIASEGSTLNPKPSYRSLLSTEVVSSYQITRSVSKNSRILFLQWKARVRPVLVCGTLASG